MVHLLPLLPGPNKWSEGTSWILVGCHKVKLAYIVYIIREFIQIYQLDSDIMVLDELYDEMLYSLVKYIDLFEFNTLVRAYNKLPKFFHILLPLNVIIDPEYAKQCANVVFAKVE